MKLVLTHPFLYTRGGAERVVLKVAQHFDAKIYCSIYEPKSTFSEFKNLDVEVIPTKVGPLFSPFPKRIRDAAVAGIKFYSLKLDDYDVINAQGTPSEWVRNRNSPVVWYCFSPNREAFDLYEWRMSRRNPLQKTLYRFFIEPYRRIEFSLVPKIEHIFTLSKVTQGRLKRYLKVDSEILYPGVDYERFHCTDYKKYFFYPSRIAPEKRFELAIEAFKKFRAKTKDKGWKLIIAGALIHERPDHVAYYEKIKKMIEGYGEIKLNLPTNEITKLYAECFSVLFTPIDEDFGLIPLEALSSYKPCIAVNEGGPSEILKDGQNAFLVNSVEEMADKMKFLAENKSIAEEMGKNGRKYVEKNFNWKKFLGRFEKVCRSTARGASK